MGKNKKNNGGIMAKKKKITRKQLLKEPDEFITFTGKLFRFAKKYPAQISYTLGGIFILIIAISGIEYFSNKAENEALALLGKGITKYATIVKNEGPDKAFLDVDKDFQDILGKYSRKDGGKLTRVVYANICYKAGHYDKAIKLFNKALEDFDDNQFIKNLILSSIGYVFKERKDYKTAAKYFEMIVAEPEAVMKDEALFNLGWIYDAIGNYDKSINAFNKIISDHTDSMYIEIEKERLPVKVPKTNG